MAGVESNERVHVTDMFTTLLHFAGSEVPSDRLIDGIDQTSFFLGKQANSSRDGHEKSRETFAPGLVRADLD